MSDEFGAKARHTIDEIDLEITGLIQERFDAVTSLHIWKKMNDLPLKDSRRESTVIETYRRELGDDGEAIAKAIIGSV